MLRRNGEVPPRMFVAAARLPRYSYSYSTVVYFKCIVLYLRRFKVRSPTWTR